MNKLRGPLFAVVMFAVIGWVGFSIWEISEEKKIIKDMELVVQNELDMREAEKQRRLELNIEHIWRINPDIQRLNEELADSLHSHILLVTTNDSLGPKQVVQPFLGNWFYNNAKNEIIIIFAGEVTNRFPIKKTDTFLIWENVDLK